MKGIAQKQNGRLVWKYDSETIWIEPWGEDSLRVRVTRLGEMPQRDWALEQPRKAHAVISIAEEGAYIRNGNLTAHLDGLGYLSFTNAQGKVVLQERWETRDVSVDMMATDNYARILKRFGGGMAQAMMTFEPHAQEKIFGMGQRQLPCLDLKGCELELCHKNSQTSIPFYLSSLGYGFLWNNPAVGTVNFAKNLTRWTAQASDVIDYWVTVGDSPASIMEHYTDVTGRAGTFPEWASGFWQSKLRYKTQDEVLAVAQEYKKRGLPISVIVIDFFHWEHQGDWRFDPKCFPDPKQMVEALREMGIMLMVSVWPTVEPQSENYAEMKTLGYLTQTNRGVRTQLHCLGAQVFFDPTSQEAREYLYQKLKENYGKHGIRLFWLDEAEPEFQHFDFDLYQYHAGAAQAVGGIYPRCYAQALYEGMRRDGIEDPMNLTRSAWAGSQKYGTLLWSGDIYSSFRAFRMQMRAGLHAGLSGLPWWTSDIGGFWGGDPQEPAYRELLIRWFQFGVFSPVCRLHGHRKPSGCLPEVEDSGLFDFNTCGPNEVWSYGEACYAILKDLLLLREKIRPYVQHLAQEASRNGAPILRTLFFNFPQDDACWHVEDQAMLGADFLIAPILYEGMRERAVYLPKGADWLEYGTGQRYTGGQTICADAPLERMPFYIRSDSQWRKALLSNTEI